jgi:hypothetical protein
MCQDKVYKFLKKNPNKWISTREIDSKLKQKCSSANLRKLFIYKEVERKKLKLKENNYWCFFWRIRN